MWILFYLMWISFRTFKFRCKNVRSKKIYKSVFSSVGPAEKIPVSDSVVDLLVCSLSLHFFDLPAFYAEVERVLKPGGCLAAYGFAEIRALHQDGHTVRLKPAVRKVSCNKKNGEKINYIQLPPLNRTTIDKTITLWVVRLWWNQSFLRPLLVGPDLFLLYSSLMTDSG